jgi:hypothetical protein
VVLLSALAPLVELVTLVFETVSLDFCSYSPLVWGIHGTVDTSWNLPNPRNLVVRVLPRRLLRSMAFECDPVCLFLASSAERR